MFRSIKRLLNLVLVSFYACNCTEFPSHMRITKRANTFSGILSTAVTKVSLWKSKLHSTGEKKFKFREFQIKRSSLC